MARTNRKSETTRGDLKQIGYYCYSDCCDPNAGDHRASVIPAGQN